jgi:hypothetical protein
MWNEAERNKLSLGILRGCGQCHMKHVYGVTTQLLEHIKLYFWSRRASQEIRKIYGLAVSFVLLMYPSRRMKWATEQLGYIKETQSQTTSRLILISRNGMVFANDSMQAGPICTELERLPVDTYNNRWAMGGQWAGNGWAMGGRFI